MKQIFFNLIVLVLFLLVTGCESNLIQNEQGKQALKELQKLPTAEFGETTLETLRNIPQLKVDMPSKLHLWEKDEEVLRDSIAAHGGQAIIGLKAPESERMRKNNIREALSTHQFEAGLKMLIEKGVEITDVYNSLGAASVRMEPDYVLELFNHPRIDFIDFPITYKLNTSRVKYSSVSLTTILQPTQTTPWGINLVNAPQAWSHTTGTGASVMIIDTGMEDHVDLPDRPNTNCDGTFNGCADGPIYHGTHVSGSLMALNNSTGVVGVAPGISDNDVYSWGACNSFTGACDTDAIVAGINAAINEDIDVINMSLGGPNSQSILAMAVSSAWSNGLVLIAAAGNHPNPNYNPGDKVYPAGYGGVVGVSGIDDNGIFADLSPCTTDQGDPVFSNHGPHVDISAPFWALSTVGTSNYEDETDGWCGTSMATPHVSGTAALLRVQNPSWSNQQIVEKLKCTANHPNGSYSYDEYYGHGVLDTEAAVASSSGAPFTNVSWQQQVQEDGDIKITFKGHTTVIPVTTSSNIFYAVLNGVNGDGSAHMTATGGGSNKIIFESKTTGTQDNGQYVYIDFDPTWMDPNGQVFSATQLIMSCGHD